MNKQATDPLERRAESLRRMKPAFVADIVHFGSAEGGRKHSIFPGWGCPCVVNDLAFDGWPVLDEPHSPGEARSKVPFVFLTPEGAEALRGAGRFFLCEGRIIGEAVIVAQ